MSATSRGFTYFGSYFAIVALVANAASSKGMCGPGNFRPPCGGFAFGVALYGAIAICTLTMLMTLGRVILRRRVSLLLRSSAILYAGALLSFVLPLRGAGNKLEGAIIVLMVFPISVTLLTAAFTCAVVCACRVGAKKSERG